MVQNLIGGSRTGPDRLPVRRPHAAGAVLMRRRRAGLVQVGVLPAAPRRGLRPLGDYMAARLHRRAALARRARRSTGWSGSTRTPSSAGAPTPPRCSRSRPVGVVLLYLLQRLQDAPAAGSGSRQVEPALAFNTAVSFVTNTNWQSYSGEATMGHLVQMAGLAVQNFVSAAVGLAVAVALIRGFARAATDRLGNFWVDLVRGARPHPAADRRRRRDRADRAAASSQNLAAGVDVTTLAGGTQTIPGVRSPRRRRSRSSARTAAASSTPTPRTRSRTRTR